MKLHQKYKLIVVGIFFSALLFNISSIINYTGNKNSLKAGECRWATREVSNGWEAICISTGVGYTCTCGAVKEYPSLAIN